MDNELINMCGCPEIQDRWEPKYGDMYWSDKRQKRDFCIVMDDYTVNRITLRRYNYRYIPRIEDVLEWLGRDNFHKITEDIEREQIKFNSAQDFLILMIKFFMYFEHNKTWNGEVWK